MCAVCAEVVAGWLREMDDDVTNFNEYMRDYMLRRYHARRSEWLKRLGGVCVDCCGADRLEFDHDDPSTKTQDIARILAGGSKTRVEREMSLCRLRCQSCHAAKSVRESGKVVEHGGGVSGRRNCGCGPCRARKAEYMRGWKAGRSVINP